MAKHYHININDALNQARPLRETVALDNDLYLIARGKPANIIQDIYELQAQRNRERSNRFTNSFDKQINIGNGKHLHLHFRDKFVESEHPRGQPGNAGEFVKGGSATKKPNKAKSKRVSIKRTTSTKTDKPKEKQTYGGGGTAGTQTFVPWQHGDPMPAHVKDVGPIPPAWTNIFINPDPKGHLVVVGKDAAGRRQPRYSKQHTTGQSADKFARVKKLESKFDTILTKNEKFMKSRDQKTSDAASLLALIIATGIRPGSEKNTARQKAYGATTLEGQHVKPAGNGKVRLDFIGKEGVHQDIMINDPAIASMLASKAEKAGETGQLFPTVNASTLLNHVKFLGGKDFKTKDFRTLLATKVAKQEIANREPPKNIKEYKKFTKEVATKVSGVLGNTPTMAMRSYIMPSVWAEWRVSSGTT